MDEDDSGLLQDEVVVELVDAEVLLLLYINQVLRIRLPLHEGQQEHEEHEMLEDQMEQHEPPVQHDNLLLLTYSICH